MSSYYAIFAKQIQATLNTNNLIIGQGLAGSLLAMEFLKRGEDFMVIDDGLEDASSRLALGAYTPIYGKRMVANEDINLYIKKAQETYAEIEKTIQKKVFFQVNTYQAFVDEEEKKAFNQYSLNPALKPFLNFEPEKHANIRTHLGAYEVLQTGRLDCPLFIDEISSYLKSQNKYRSEIFENDQLFPDNDHSWRYKGIHAKKIIFCQGYKNIYNPFFNDIPFAPSRGLLLYIYAPELGQKKILKKGITLIPTGEGVFIAGSTYERDDLTPNSDALGRIHLEMLLKEMMDCEYRILGQKSGIRPATKDRNPVLGRHPIYKEMYILNGFGSRGVLLAPYFSALMIDFINNFSQISREFDVKRFYKYFKNG